MDHFIKHSATVLSDDHAIRLRCLELAVEAMKARGNIVDADEWARALARLANAFERYVTGAGLGGE